METINTNVVKQQPKLTGQIGNTLIYVDPDLEDKKVEIVENGVYTIKADEKFDGLNEVEISTKVNNYKMKNTSYMFELKKRIEEIPDILTIMQPNSGAYTFYKAWGTSYSTTNGTYVVDLNKLDTSEMTSMYQMFYNCYELNKLDVSEWDVSKVTSMYQSFYSCTSLTELDLSNWKPTNLTNMYQMFYKCERLSKLNLSNWDMINVTSMSGAFEAVCLNRSCNIILTGSKTSPKLTNISRLFWGNRSTSLDVSLWDTSGVTNMSETFYGCSGLTSLNLSNWRTSNVTNMYRLFYGCSSLTSLDLSSFDTSNVTNMSEMFYTCNALKTLDIRNFDFTNVTSYSTMLGMPTSCLIIVKDNAAKEWLNDKFPKYTNIKTVAEL